jgi:polyisoprenoid-binding protein YceI
MDDTSTTFVKEHPMNTDTADASDLAQLTGDYTLDPAHTRIGFVARHAMVTKVRGSFHDLDGTIHVDGENLANSRGQLTIRAKSIDTGNADRDAHLRSNDFFAMDEYPQITFVSTAVEPVDAAHYRVTGDLTMRGVSRPVTVDFAFTGAATDPFGNLRVGLEGSVTVNRKDWGVNWNAALEAGGVLVSEKVTLELDISAIRNA